MEASESKQTEAPISIEDLFKPISEAKTIDAKAEEGSAEKSVENSQATTSSTEGEATTEAAKETPAPVEKMVPLTALQEERMKRRELKRRLDELEKKIAAQSSDSYTAPAYGSEPAPSTGVDPEQYRKDRLIQTVNVVRATRGDATEMLELFDKAVEENPELYEKMYTHSDPGAFAYEFGRTIKIQETYGSTPEEAFKRGVAEATKATKEKVFNELKGKKELGDKLPKNIARIGSSGTGSTPAEWTNPNSKELWG